MPHTECVTYKPKQKRSERNLTHIINAIMKLVEDKYFEQITIADITKEANLSVGAFYRRFENKEAALPVIYAYFQNELREWLKTKAELWHTLEFEALIEDMTQSIYAFVFSKKGVFRTIHLNARLHSPLLQPSTLKERVNDFNYLANFFEPFMEKGNTENVCASQFAVFTMVNNAIEKCVYPNITPAIGCPHDFQQSIAATNQLLFHYLTAEFGNS